MVPARVEKLMPAGVSPLNSRFTTKNPFTSGSITTMHSKQPQQVMGYSMTLYREQRSTSPWEAFLTKRFTPSNSPRIVSISFPFSTGWFAPDGAIS